MLLFKCRDQSVRSYYEHNSSEIPEANWGMTGVELLVCAACRDLIACTAIAFCCLMSAGIQ
jgi:hypothetical protein